MRKYLVILAMLVAVQVHATVAIPTNISTMSFAAGVLTVNSTAHGLIANGGFCIMGSIGNDNFCGTVLTITNANTFTTKWSGGVLCAALCGTVRPAKFFLIHGDPPFPAQGELVITYCIWNTTTTPLPQVGAVSACAADETDGTLLGLENAALTAGTIVETVKTETFPANWDITKVFNFLLDLQFSKQLALAASAQPGRDSGRFCDTTGCN